MSFSNALQVTANTARQNNLGQAAQNTAQSLLGSLNLNVPGGPQGHLSQVLSDGGAVDDLLKRVGQVVGAGAGTALCGAAGKEWAKQMGVDPKIGEVLGEKIGEFIGKHVGGAVGAGLINR